MANEEVETADWIERLRTAIDEDERIAQRAGADEPSWIYHRETFTVASASYPIAGYKGRNGPPINDVDGEHMALHDPARVLRQVAAHRKILELHHEQPAGKCFTCSYTNWMQIDVGEWPCHTVRALAEAYGLGELLPPQRETDADLY